MQKHIQNNKEIANLNGDLNGSSCEIDRNDNAEISPELPYICQFYDSVDVDVNKQIKFMNKFNDFIANDLLV